jgi:hypothetical protein
VQLVGRLFPDAAALRALIVTPPELVQELVACCSIAWRAPILGLRCSCT